MQDCFAFSECSPWGRCLTQFLKTRGQYAPILSYFLSHPAKPVEDYTQEDVLSYLSLPCRGNRNKGGIPSIATSNQRLAVLKSWYSFSATFTVEGTDGHPERLLKVVPPTFGLKGGKPHIEYRALSFDEMERLFAVIPTDTPRGLRDRALFLTYFYTARRRNEIARLLWGDIERATLIGKEERREGWVYRWKGKGHPAKDDLAELPLPAKQAIDTYLIASGRMETIKASDPVFVATDLNAGIRFDKSKPLDDESIARRLKYYLRQARLDTKRISLHSLRHTAARMRMEAGEEMLDLQHLLRHASLDMTYRYITKLVTTADSGAKLLEKRFGHL